MTEKEIIQGCLVLIDEANDLLDANLSTIDEWRGRVQALLSHIESGRLEEIAKRQPNMEQRFICLYYRYKAPDCFEADSIEEGIAALESGNESGECLPVAVINRLSGEMVWWATEFFEKEDAQQMVSKFLNKLGEEKK